MDGFCEGERNSGGPWCGRRECKMEDDKRRPDPPWVDKANDVMMMIMYGFLLETCYFFPYLSSHLMIFCKRLAHLIHQHNPRFHCRFYAWRCNYHRGNRTHLVYTNLVKEKGDCKLSYTYYKFINFEINPSHMKLLVSIYTIRNRTSRYNIDVNNEAMKAEQNC